MCTPTTSKATLGGWCCSVSYTHLDVYKRQPMEYKRFGNKIIARIDKDEEILEQVKELALSLIHI